MPTHRLELLPAVDVRDGQAVRLVHGESGSETSYGDPMAAALAWQRAGAEWLHLVDLDAAFGTGDNRAQIAEVARSMDIKVELSGGIRDDASLAAALATGCTRVNIGTAALENPEWVAKIIAEYGDRIAVGLDVRGTTLRGRGWTRDGGDLYETLERLHKEGWGRHVRTHIPQAVPATSSPTSPRTARSRAPTWTCCGACAPSRTAPSSPPAACPPWTTCGP